MEGRLCISYVQEPAHAATSNYWLTKNDDTNRSFSVDLGCPARITQVLLRNTSNRVGDR